MADAKQLLVFLILFFSTLYCTAQLKPVYTFQKDDTLLKRKYYNQSVQTKDRLVNALGKEYKDDYKNFYESRLETVKDLLISSRTVTDSIAHRYLQSLVNRIIAANPELKGTDLRTVFTRDWWPNAYSIGDGTLAVNAGLMVYMNNEAELAFAISHEIAHYYLDHSTKAIKKYVETVNSDEFQKELKRLSKEQYRVNEQLEKLAKNIVFDNRRHSRDKEAEADRYGFLFMKRAGFDGMAVKTTLQMLDKVDDTAFFKPLNLAQELNFPGYPFKDKWIKKESAIFGAMGADDASGLTKKEKDSLKTHPDCSKRIDLLQDSFPLAPGKNFIMDEKTFTRLKQDFIPEIVEQCYHNDNLGRNLYYCLQMMEAGQNRPLAIYSVARDLNILYDKQKVHKLGLMVAAEDRSNPEDYNQLLRLLNRVRLDELASLAYHFCLKYEDEMKTYEGFEEELNKAKKNLN